MPFLLRQFRALASPVALAPGELGALTQPRSPTRETALFAFGSTVAQVSEISQNFYAPREPSPEIGVFMMSSEIRDRRNEFHEGYMPHLSAIRNWKANIVKLQAEQPASARLVHPLRC